MITNESVDGATLLDPDELAGLKFKHITMRSELDELEQANIVQGMLWIKKTSNNNFCPWILYPKSLELQLGGKGTQPHELSCTK
jgi:fido (protein-threonine AMPylation protein)